MKELKNLKGLVFGNIRVIGFDHNTGASLFWKCECVKCGTTVVLRHRELKMTFINHCPVCGKLDGRYLDARKTYDVYCTMAKDAIGKTARKNPSSYYNVGIVPEWHKAFPTFVGWLIENKYVNGCKDTIICYDGSGDPVGPKTMSIESRSSRRSRSNCLLITYNGESKPLSKWAAISGVRLDTIYQRINTYGWDTGKAIFTKPHQKSNTPVYDHNGNIIYYTKSRGDLT